MSAFSEKKRAGENLLAAACGDHHGALCAALRYSLHALAFERAGLTEAAAVLDGFVRDEMNAFASFSAFMYCQAPFCVDCARGSPETMLLDDLSAELCIAERLTALLPRLDGRAERAAKKMISDAAKHAETLKNMLSENSQCGEEKNLSVKMRGRRIFCGEKRG